MDVEKILDKLSELQLVRVNRRIGNYMNVYCPFHNDGNERRPSCGVLIVDEVRGGQTYKAGWWHCFTCGSSYNMAEAVTRILSTHSITKSGDAWLAENVEGYESDNEFEALLANDLVESTINNFAIEQLKTLQGQTEKYVSEEELASYRYTVPYMYERKLTDEVIAKYDVGVDMNWTPAGRKKPVPCITFPVNDPQGHTLFICRRSIEGKLYNYPQGVTKPVYGIDKLPNNCKSIIICESIINALTATVYGYDAVALLGTGNSMQIAQLKTLGVREFVICTDGDDAGRKSAAKLKRALSNIALVWIVPMPDGKDLNDLSKEEFDLVYSKRE